MDRGDSVSPQYSDDERQLRQQVEGSESALADLEAELQAIDAQLEELGQGRHHYAALDQVCNLLEELKSGGAGHLFWDAQVNGDNPEQNLRFARQNIERFGDEIDRVEAWRMSIIEKIGEENQGLDHLHYDLRDVIEREEALRNQWVIEREFQPVPHRAQVMPWSRGGEEDQRFRKTVGMSLTISLALAFILSSIALPMMKRSTVNELPERVARLVRQERQLPPEPVAEPVVQEQEMPNPEPLPEPVEELPAEQLPVSTEKPVFVNVGQPVPAAQVRSRGILAFRESFAAAADLRPASQLGLQARINSAGSNEVGRPERLLVASSAPGSSGGINLSDISRDVGGGGQEIGGVEVSRVASTIGGGSGPNRPLSGGAVAGRTDEEIQIVFDRYKAVLYRLYNRELRKDPTLRGQMVLRLTIEPDGSVSLCELHSSDMGAPALVQQVIDRVHGFDFGARENIVSMTIIYPIDFLPAG